jgi:hypothetical protein
MKYIISAVTLTLGLLTQVDAAEVFETQSPNRSPLRTMNHLEQSLLKSPLKSPVAKGSPLTKSVLSFPNLADENNPTASIIAPPSLGDELTVEELNEFLITPIDVKSVKTPQLEQSQKEIKKKDFGRAEQFKKGAVNAQLTKKKSPRKAEIVCHEVVGSKFPSFILNGKPGLPDVGILEVTPGGNQAVRVSLKKSWGDHSFNFEQINNFRLTDHGDKEIRVSKAARLLKNRPKFSSGFPCPIPRVVKLDGMIVVGKKGFVKNNITEIFARDGAFMKLNGPVRFNFGIKPEASMEPDDLAKRMFRIQGDYLSKANVFDSREVDALELHPLEGHPYAYVQGRFYPRGDSFGKPLELIVYGAKVIIRRTAEDKIAFV